MKRIVKQISSNLDKNRAKQEKRQRLIDQMKAQIEQQPLPDLQEETPCIEILEGKEKESALRSDYSKDGNKITLVLQISKDGNDRKEVIRLDRVNKSKRFDK